MAMQHFSGSLPMLLYRALDAVMPRFRIIFNEFGLTEQQWRILRVLWEHEELAFSELAELTRIPRPSMVGIVDRLSEAGLVARRRSDRDRRNVYVYATEKGGELEATVMPRVAQTYADLKAQVDDGIWEQVIDGLAVISNVEPPARAHKATAIVGEKV